MRIRSILPYLIFTVFLGVASPASGARRILTTSFQLRQNVFTSASAVVMRVKVELINISNIDQKVKIQMHDVFVNQGVGLDTEARGDVYYSAWVKNEVFRHVRSRRLNMSSVSDLPELVVPANGKRYQSLSFACLINNISETSYTCSRDETILAGYVPPYPLSRVEAASGGRFEITTLGPNMDRGALLASYSVSLLFGLESQELTREINGGRPF